MVIQKIREKASTFKSEFKKQTTTAIMAALGLVIALSWKDVINYYLEKIGLKSHGLIISAILVTFLSVIGIVIISKWANQSQNKAPENKNGK